MEKPTFKEALLRFKHVGEIYFRGHYHDNVLNIFNELSEEDRKALLRCMYLVYDLIDKGDAEIANVDVAARRTTEAPAESDQVTKMTASSSFIIVMLLVLLFIISILFIIVGMDSNPNSAFKNLFRVIGFFFG